LKEDPRADVVYSVGLIEHFDAANTRVAIRSHFRLLKPGGIAVISFPTPTLLYRVARTLCEVLRVWKFHDERPLTRDEVVRTLDEEGEILEEKTLWPLILTQQMIVIRKAATRQPVTASAMTATSSRL
jgi:predicted SAM-dependent methyltransferase